MTFDEWWDEHESQYLADGCHMSDYHMANIVWEAAQAAEREACAKECERMIVYQGGRQEAPAHDNVWAAAKAIRARSPAQSI